MRSHSIFSKLFGLQNFIFICIVLLLTDILLPFLQKRELLIFSPSITFPAIGQFDKFLHSYSDCVKLKFNSQNRRWSPSTCLMVQTGIVELPIHSLYPETGNRHAISLGNEVVYSGVSTIVECMKTACRTTTTLLQDYSIRHSLELHFETKNLSWASH